jgi:hypothetical protein
MVTPMKAFAWLFYGGDRPTTAAAPAPDPAPPEGETPEKVAAEEDRWLRSWRQRVIGAIVRRDITTPLQWRHYDWTPLIAAVKPAAGPYVVCDGPRGFADFDFVASPIVTAETIRGLDGRYLAVNRIPDPRPPPPPPPSGAAAVGGRRPHVRRFWQYTSVAFPAVAHAPSSVRARAPWVLCVGDRPDDPAAAAAFVRALAGLVAWFALGGPVPAVTGAYPDIYALFRAGLRYPRVESDPLELIVAVARVIGNEGVDYALRLALRTLLPPTVDGAVTPDVDAWFVGIEFCARDTDVERSPTDDDDDAGPRRQLLWLGGPVENKLCDGPQPPLQIRRFLRRIHGH